MAEQETSLSLGSRGEVVKELQQWLNQFTGASLKEDGKYGQKTSQAVSNFQRESGIEQDGIAGVNTIESIISYEGESNEEEENEEIIQGAEEEVTPTAQEEPEEEEVTPEEEAEFEEPVQAPAAPEQDTTPEVTPEEEVEFAAPEGEDPALSQQPQATTVSQEPVPAGQVGDQQADPALQPEQPSPEDLATAARYASYANRPTPQPAPAQGQPAPGPVPDEIPQATKKIQQQTAGNYQKFHKPAQPSTNPATNTVVPEEPPADTELRPGNPQQAAQASTDPAVNTITPADFNNGISPQTNNSQPQAQASTDPATNTIAPEEVPMQGYSSRDQFRNDLSKSFLSLKQMINSNSKDGLQDLQAQLANIQQRAQASGQDFPKLTKYLTDLQGHAQKWGATFESKGPTHRPILTEEEKSLRQKMQSFWGGLFGDDDEEEEVDPDIAPLRKEIADTIRKNIKDEEYFPRPRAIRDHIKPATQTAHNFDYNGNFQQGIGNSGIKWTGPSIKYLTYDHKEAITSGKGAVFLKRLELHDPKEYLARLNKDINGKDASKKHRAERELRNYKRAKEWVEAYMHNGKPLIDIDMYTKIYKEEESQIPFILENGKEYNYNGLDRLFDPDGKIQQHIKYSKWADTIQSSGGELIERWEAAVDAWNEINSKIGNDETQEWQNIKDEEKRARYRTLQSKAGLGIEYSDVDYDPFGIIKALGKKLGFDNLDTTTKVGLPPEQQEAIIQKSVELGRLTPNEAEDLRELTKWYQTDYVAKLKRDEKEEEEREDKEEEAKRARPVEDHKLHQELVADLAKDVQAAPVSAQDDSLIAQDEDEEDPEFLELAKSHATRVVEFLTTTIEGIGWSEDNAPLDTDPNSKMYAEIGERINNFFANLNNYEESASTEDFAVLEKDFDEIVTLVDDYSTTT